MSVRDEFVEALKDSALEIGKREVMKTLASRIPLLAGGLPAAIAGVIVGEVLKIAMKETEMGLFFLYIDTRVDKQGAEFSEAALAYHRAPPEEKAKYEKAYLDSFYKLVSLKS